MSKIVCGDSFELIKEMPPDSIDLVITEPPYLKATENQWWGFYTDLAGVLKIGAYCVIYARSEWLDIAIRTVYGLFWGGVIALKYLKPIVRDDRKRFWKPVLIFRKGCRVEQMPDDMYVGKDMGKQLCKRLFYLYTKKGEIVFDPFCGKGSHLAIADKMGRKVVGYDINVENCQLVTNMLQYNHENRPSQR